MIQSMAVPRRSPCACHRPYKGKESRAGWRGHPKRNRAAGSCALAGRAEEVVRHRGRHTRRGRPALGITDGPRAGGFDAFGKCGSAHRERLDSRGKGGSGADAKPRARNSNSFSTMQRRSLDAFVEGLTTRSPCPSGTVPFSFRACRSNRPRDTQRSPVRPTALRYQIAGSQFGGRRSNAPLVVARWWLRSNLGPIRGREIALIFHQVVETT